MTAFPTGNIDRDGAIIVIIREIQEAGEPLTWANAGVHCSRFNQFGLLHESEFKDAVAYLERLDAGLAPETPAAESVVVEAPKMSHDEATAEIANLENEIAQTRGQVLSLQQEQRHAREVLQRAVHDFGVGGHIIPTREELMRAEIAANQERLIGLAKGTIAPPVKPAKAKGTFRDRTRGRDSGPGAAERFARQSHNGGQSWRGEARFGRGDVYDKTLKGGAGGIRPRLPSES